ncbi:MAG: leucine-rich repeat domain-containing protein, partial [Bacteroidales bacterium]|nr:leucine-rich repeat domain-containing protein [Bacteroidales bacterium]
MKKLNLLRAALLALLLGVVAVSDSYGQDISTSQKQTAETSNLVCTVAEFAGKYQTLKKGENVSITLTDVNDENIKRVKDVIGSNGYKINLILQSPNKGLTRIRVILFSYCKSLASIIIPEGVTEIEPGAFLGCRSLTDITIPEGVTEIGYNSFEETSITELKIPQSVKNWGDYTFKNGHLIGITIPDGITEIESAAFNNCKNLTSITIPESVTEIEYNAFENTSITDLKIPKSVKNWGDYKFENGHLISITIPDDVTEIKKVAFIGCKKLTNITIPEGVTGIGWKAFSCCFNLTSITIPNSVKWIGSDVF